MTRDEQDKLWAELSEESRKRVVNHYYGDTAGIGSQFEDRKKCFERIFGKHNLKPMLTYEDVANELFENKTGYVFDVHDCIKEFNFGNCGLPLPLNCTTKRQAEKLQAINMLLNVAKYLNGDWVPDWENFEEDKFCFLIDYENKDEDEDAEINFICSEYENASPVYFRTKELAKQAIQILGEETIRTAFTTDY